MPVYVFAQDAGDFSTMGLCGLLTPTSCMHQEKRNGLSQLTLVHPIDDAGRWATLIPGRILSAEVPVRTIAEIDEGGTLVTTVEKWRMKTTATKGQRGLYSKASGGKRLKTLPIWADKKKTQRLSLTVTRKGENRYKVKTKYGSGWVAIAAIEHEITETIPNDPTAIEVVEPAWTVKPQLFRIREVELTGKSVTVTASHIFYDLAGNLTTWSGYVESTGANNPTCIEALAGILDNAFIPHDFDGRTNILDRRVEVKWTDESIIEALMAPETGLLDRWGAELVRDNFEFTILREAGLNRGVRIEYGKNLLGVTVTTDVTSVVTRVMPIGKTHKDKPLHLTAGTYNINDTIVTIAPGEKWVTSAEASNYPTPLIAKLETDIKAKSGDAADVLAARKKMIEQALQLFEDEGVDKPSVNVRVEFLKLGDTIEYEQYKRLDDLFLCDRVRVRHPGIGVDVLTEVIETNWDCLTGRFTTIELGSVQLDLTRASVQPYQLSSGISGNLLAPGSVSGYALGERSVGTAHIQLAAITQALIAELAVGTAQIADAAITQAKINTAEINWASIANLAADIANIAKAQITAANIEAANIDWANITALASDVATIAKGVLYDADIQWADIENLQAAVAQIVSAQIVSAEIDFAKIMDLEAQSAIIRKGIADELYIDRLAITSAAMVSATLGELVIKGDDDKYYQITVADGTIGTTEVTVTEGEIAAGQTSTGRKIVETELDVVDLNAQTIKAASAILGEIVTTALSAGKISAAQAMLAAATIPQLTTDAINAIGDKMTFTANSVIQMLLGVSGQIGKWFTFSNEDGLLIRKPAYTDEHGVEHPASIWSTQTDETGYHIRRSDMPEPIGSFARDRLIVDGTQIGTIVARRTSAGGWVWTDA